MGFLASWPDDGGGKRQARCERRINVCSSFTVLLILLPFAYTISSQAPHTFFFIPYCHINFVHLGTLPLLQPSFQNSIVIMSSRTVLGRISSIEVKHERSADGQFLYSYMIVEVNHPSSSRYKRFGLADVSQSDARSQVFPEPWGSWRRGQTMVEENGTHVVREE